MIGDKMQKAINEQIKHELESAYLYMSMAAHFHAIGFDGMAQWMRIQTQEELLHAQKFIDHLVDRDGRVEFLALAQPQKEWDSPLAAFEAAYSHEQFITGKINELVSISRDENDNAAGIMLQWFVTEQVEEESTASTIVGTLRQIGDSGSGLFLIDRELGQRQLGGTAAPEGTA